MSDIEENDEDFDLEEDESEGVDEAELAQGIALGELPFLGQAIDVYDTIESAIRLHNADTPASKEEAQFDLVLAIIGWISGPGDGVKKSLRLVNRYPKRFAPMLYDFLRSVLEECGIRSSPEKLLGKILNAQALQSQIDEIIAGVKNSSAFEALPRSVQIDILDILFVARDNFPSLLGIVERRLLEWRGKQSNNSAMTSMTSESSIPERAGSDRTGLLMERANVNSSWLELNLYHDNLEPVAHAPYRVEFNDGSVREGILDEKGHAHLENVPIGPAKIYYGEDPRDFELEPIKSSKTTQQDLENDLKKLGLDPSQIDIDTLIAQASGRQL